MLSTVTHGSCGVYVGCMLGCSHVKYKVKSSCGVLCEASYCLTLGRAGRVRSRSDTAPGVAACPLALELRAATRPFRLLTWHWKTRRRAKANKLNSHKVQKKMSNQPPVLRRQCGINYRLLTGLRIITNVKSLNFYAFSFWTPTTTERLC